MFSRRKNLLFVYNRPIYVDLHMLFVFFPTDAIHIDEKGYIREIIHMKPFRGTYRALHKALHVLELTEKHTFKVGDRVVIDGNEISKAI